MCKATVININGVFAGNGSNGMKGCGLILAFLSWVLVALSFPLSLCVCIKVSLFRIIFMCVT